MSLAPSEGPVALALACAAPLLGALGVAAMRDAQRARLVAGAVATSALLLSLFVLARFHPAIDGFQHVTPALTIPGTPLVLRLGVDGLSVLAIPMVALVALAALLVAPTLDLPPRVAAAVLALEGATIGAFAAIDVGAFAFFAALSLAPVLERFRPSSGTSRASRGVFGLFLAHQLLGLAALLGAVATLARATSHGSLDLETLVATGIDPRAATPSFLLLLAYALLRAGIFPGHTWLPLLIGTGPFPLAVLFASAPLGVYALARIALPLLPDVVAAHADLLTGLALATLAYGALVALVQRELRRTLTYLFVSQTGLVLFGIAAHNVLGLAGAMLDSLGVGLAAAGVLLLTEALEARVGAARVRELAGFGRAMPRLAVLFFLFGLGVVGFPGSPAFVGEDLLMHGMFEIHPVIAAVALLGPALNGFTFLRAFGRTFLGRGGGAETASASDLLPRERVGALVLGGVCLLAGLVPGPLLDAQRGAVHAMHPSDDVTDASSR